MTANTTELLAAYDHDVRGSFPRRLPATWSATTDGALTRCVNDQGGFVLSASRLTELSDDEIGELVDRTVQHYAELGLAFEWKTFSHDNAMLLSVLIDRGFQPREAEALVLGPVAALTGEVTAVDGVTVREAGIADLPAIAAMQSAVWGTDWSWFVAEMTARMSADDPAYVLLAEADDQVVSAAWLTPMPGTSCAGLWGGSTLADYRRRGIYRALVTLRANEAQRRGYSLLQVDATDDSRPILEKLGLTVVSTTTPYWWTPAQ